MDFTTFSPALIIITVVALALAPFVAVMVTSFTKLVVVLSLLRNALGLQQVPPNVVLNGLAIVLSIYVMYPVILDTNAAINGRPPVTLQTVPKQSGPPATLSIDGTTVTARAPGAQDAPASPAAADAEAAEAAEAAAQGSSQAAERGPTFANVVGSNASPQTPPAPPTTPATTMPTPSQQSGTGNSAVSGLAPGGKMDLDRMLRMIDVGKEPLRQFLLRHSNSAERAFFLRSAQRLLPPAARNQITAEDFIVVIPAFTVSELTAAFQIGFLIYLPFLIIDLVVSNLLLALGMMMMSPTTVSLPFKILLFVLIDGWAKLVHGLVLTYGT